MKQNMELYTEGRDPTLSELWYFEITKSQDCMLKSDIPFKPKLFLIIAYTSMILFYISPINTCKCLRPLQLEFMILGPKVG